MFSWPALTLAAHLQKSEWFRENYRGPYAKISPGCSLEGLMLKLKLQYFGHLMRRVGSLEKTMMLGGIKRTTGWDGWMASPTRWTWIWVTPGVGDGQGGLACCNSWGCKQSDTTEQLNSTVLLVLARSISCRICWTLGWQEGSWGRRAQSCGMWTVYLAWSQLSHRAMVLWLTGHNFQDKKLARWRFSSSVILILSLLVIELY